MPDALHVLLLIDDLREFESFGLNQNFQMISYEMENEQQNTVRMNLIIITETQKQNEALINQYLKSLVLMNERRLYDLPFTV